MYLPSVTRITSSHHIFGVEKLLGQLGHGERAVGLAVTRGERGKTGHEEMKTGEGDHVDGKLSEISIELTRESETGCNTRHGGTDQVVQIPVGRSGQFQCSEANVIKGFVVDAISLVSVLDKLMD